MMKIKEFKSHTITRSTPPHYDEYSKYKPYLAQDFCNRCAYCNLSDCRITTPFEVDHFIPETVFKHTHPELKTDYNNLIYSCKKCNGTKSGKFKGDMSAENPTNEMFYDPVQVDYNKIFFRNEFGAIDSNDTKGREMIKNLKLYRPIHILGWLCEEIDKTADSLELAISKETNETKKREMEQACIKLNAQYRSYINLFISSYNDNKFKFIWD